MGEGLLINTEDHLKEKRMLELIPGNLDHFLAEDDDKPITMLNLLRFKPDGGRERYFEYLGMAGPLVARYGAQIVFTGLGMTALAAEHGQSWDAVALVRYPTRRAFAQMIADPDYKLASPVRKAALIEAVLQPITTT
jgi:uncharacterized protein (DUF1330 family)